MITFENVAHIFADGTLALQDVNLSLKKGEFCVLLGPSGAGKSTLMNVINGVVNPTHGNVTVAGERLTRKTKTQIRRKVSMIHQQLHLVPRLAVLHNVLAGVLHQVSLWRCVFKVFPHHQQRRACQLLEKVGLEEKHLYRRVTHLSGGQQQRVAIARAFMSKPQVVLADEPVASLDPAMSRSVLMDLKNAAASEQATVLCSLHQLEYALEFADRIIALKEGRIFFDGSPAQMDDQVQSLLYQLTRDEQQDRRDVEEVAA